MKPLETLGRVRTADDQDLVLYRRDGEYQLRVNGLELMSSRANGSERALAGFAFEELGNHRSPRVLVGGLGFGYTLRATLDRIPSGGSVTVAEVFAGLVEWNRGPVGPLASNPLRDPRVTVEVADVYDVLSATTEPFDVILLDVDNGPEAFTLESNQRIYQRDGLRRARQALHRKGVLAFWSAYRSPNFVRLVEKSGFDVKSRSAPARGDSGGHLHHIILARPGNARKVRKARAARARRRRS